MRISAPLKNLNHFIEIRKEIRYLELSDTLRSKTLQLRRHEKNFLLYRDIKERENVHAYIHEISDILQRNQKNDAAGHLSSLNVNIGHYDETFRSIETNAEQFMDNFERLKMRNIQYQMFFPLMESTFLESPSVNAGQMKVLFGLDSNSPVLENLRQLHAGISDLRKIGEEILTVSKQLDTVTREKVGEANACAHRCGQHPRKDLVPTVLPSLLDTSCKEKAVGTGGA